MSTLDQILLGIDNLLRMVFPPENRLCQRSNPAEDIVDIDMDDKQREHTAGLMRVNHAGEVCAQALYHGQALTASLSSVKQQMLEASNEELDHLAWCEQRLKELQSNPSILNVFWYSGSFILGAIAGLAGDKWSLGFVAETERQVASHLQNHLKKLVNNDQKTKKILSQMYKDETQHAKMAIDAGAVELPSWIRQIMSGVSKCLTYGSYYY